MTSVFGVLAAFLMAASPAAAKGWSVRRLAKELAGAPASEKPLMLKALGASGKARAVRRLLEDFDPETGRPEEAGLYARALGAAGLQIATDPLLSALERLESLRLRSPSLPAGTASLRLEIAEALAEIADIKAIPVLRSAMTDPDERIVRAAVGGLGRLKDSRSADWIARLTSSPDPETARAAFAALGELGGEGPEAVLLKAAGEGGADRRVAAACALAKLGRERGFLLLDGFLEEVEDPYAEGLLAARCLGKLGRVNGIDYLVRAAEAKASPLRLPALEALGKTRDSRAALPLTGFLGEGDAGTRLAAVKALGEVGGSRAESALKRAMKKDGSAGVRAAAREALAGLGVYLPKGAGL